MIIAGRQVEEMSMAERAKLDALRYACERTAREGRQYVVREDHGRYFVCPHYDPGYEGMGTLVAESLKNGG